MKAAIKKQEATQCKPTEHLFMALDITPHPYSGSSLMGQQMGMTGPARQYIVYCSKCAAVKRIV